MLTLFTFSFIKISVLGSAGFLAAFLVTPLLIRFLHRHQLWRKEVRSKALGGGEVPFFKRFHGDGEMHTPRFGGVLVWLTPLALALVFALVARLPFWWAQSMNFLSRQQTWLPLGILFFASAVGFLDDLIQVVVKPSRGLWRVLWGNGEHIAGGLPLRQRLLFMAFIASVGAWWFYTKLNWTLFHVPGVGTFDIGWWLVPLFIFVMLATYSGGVIDGLDGLAGGTFASIFAAYGLIAFSRGQVNLAGFCFVVVGALLAFLWFNIPPAKFYMGETGMMGLTATLTTVAFLTDSVLVLPVIGFLLVLESGSVILQVFSKRFFGRKVFLAAPIHHHFEAKGWPHYQVTMRFWIIGIVSAIVGVALRLLG